MKRVPIRRVIDARATQGRVILHLGCGHNAFLAADEIEPEEIEGLGLDPDDIEITFTEWTCQRCADEFPDDV